MIEHEILYVVGQGGTLGIFGDQNYPNILSGKPVKERRYLISKFKRLVTVLRPKKVYIMPTKGINQSLLPILKSLGIPYVVVNPYRGYFEEPDKSDRVPLLIGLENCKSVVTISSPPSKRYTQSQILTETEDFIIDRSNLILSIYGSTPSPDISYMNKKLTEVGTNVVFLDYSIS